MEKVNEKITGAIKWSTITEVIAKLITPITNMILARLLAPEAFGVVATLTMVISFADMFTDAGFQKYIVQHDFKSKKALYNSTTVAFWSNLLISVFLWAIIAIYSDPISNLVGNPGLGQVLIIGSVSLPLTSFSSIQMALFRREFNYKSLFFVRIIGICIPIVVTIPLAYIFNNYWSLVAGIICGNLSNAIILTIKSKWKPNWFYKIDIFKEMFSFSIWSLIESISIWLTQYIGIFIVGKTLNSYYLGIYLTSMTTVNQILAIITSATTSVLFSVLSRLQNDDVEYKRMFFKFQRLVGLFVFPMGIGIFMYSDLITRILLGSQWSEAAGFIGIWGLMSSISIILGQYCSEVYRSKGKPKLSFLAQFLYLLALIPTLIIASHYSFEILYYANSLVRLHGVLVHLILVYIVIRLSPFEMLKNIAIPITCSLAMFGIAMLLQEISSGVYWDILSIFICIIFYLICINLFPSVRVEILSIVKKKKFS
ncbi:lipopolysaccharide biosynthesis protein [Bacillus sp. NTK071]|uniref:lipopolysaccharide biosynthesis protein n=1 Tax=Bacillus sp. NTK071 TaxID=2802175 RepID=UPI001A906174|nr:lipopolysaccharide biosynthesis protein [Bacillus sp. NTK071]MBN8210239.1 lipopolysaccharide biosynthesis protein [Bacillus sp. NTK071]